jgi:hypothetical protein
VGVQRSRTMREDVRCENVRRRGGTFGWPLLCPAQHMFRTQIIWFAAGKSRASLSQCAASRQLRGGVFPSQRRHLAAPFRTPEASCIIADAAASATAGLLPKTCRQNERKSAEECAAMVELFWG